MVPVPWLTSSKPAQMSWSPSMQPLSPTHTNTLKYLLSSNSLLTPQPKQSTQVTFLITRALTRSLSRYLWYLISPAVHLSFLSLPLAPGPDRALMVSGVLWHRAWSDFWMSLTRSVLCCPLVPICFQEGHQGQEAPANTQSVRFWITDLRNRK